MSGKALSQQDDEYGINIVATGRFSNGKRNGHWVIRQERGTRASEGKGAYVDGVQNGRWVITDSDGYTTEWNFVNGERQ